MGHLNSIAYRLWSGIIAGMGKEALEQSPITSLEELISQTEEQWEQNWQNLDFVKRFPKLATRLVSEGKTKLLDDDLKSMVERSLTSFISLSWKPGKPEAVAGISLIVDENLDVIPGGKGKDFESSQSRGEPLGRCLIGSLILLGKSLEDKEYINVLMSESYQRLNSGKKSNFRQHILRLVINDSFFRNWVKTHNLDSQNGFEWNRETARLFLQLYSKSDPGLPLEFGEDLKIYPLEVVDEFVDHAKKYVNESPTISKRESPKHPSPSVFIIRLQELYDRGYFDDSPLSLQVQSKIAGLIKSTQH